MSRFSKSRGALGSLQRTKAGTWSFPQLRSYAYVLYVLLALASTLPCHGKPPRRFPVKLDDIAVALPADEDHVTLVKAGRHYRKGVRTVVVSNARAPQERLLEGRQYNETWLMYPDDKPLRSLYAGDTRAALAPFIAHQALKDSYKWMLYSDDDTVWFMDPLISLLETLDPNVPYFITDHMWWSARLDPVKASHPNPDAPRCLPCEYDDSDEDRSKAPYDAPKGCPCTAELLCKTDKRGIFNKFCDIPRTPVRTFSMHGGAGAAISVGMLRAVGLNFMEKCTKSLYSTGGDAFITICLWQAGYGMTDPGYSFYHPDIHMFDPGPEDRMGILVKLVRAVERGSQYRCDAACVNQLNNMVSMHVRSRMFPSLEDAAVFMKTMSFLYDTYVELKSRDAQYGQRSQPVHQLTAPQEEALRRAHEQAMTIYHKDGGVGGR